jgi:hypothetical protein
MDNQDILQRIQDLVDEEHELRGGPEGSGNGATGQDAAGEERRSRLRRVEEELDQYWDLLRQRRAKSAVRDDPDKADIRPVSEVEGYGQ